MGVRVWTLSALARTLAEEGDEVRPSGDLLLPALVGRAIRQHPLLRALLERFDDGPRAATAIVRDLLDAGLEADDLEAARERLAELEPSRTHERTRAFLTVAGRVVDELRGMGLDPSGDLLRRARARLDDHRHPLPVTPHAVLVLGFHDATGRVTELLRALQRRLPTRVFFERSRVPLHPVATGRGDRFLERLRERLGRGVESEEQQDPPSTPSLRAFTAASRQAEAREVAERVRQLWTTGSAAEDIAICARDARTLVPFAAELAALGVPCSRTRFMVEQQPQHRFARQWQTVLRDREKTSLEDWWALVGTAADDSLCYWLRERGLTRLQQLASLANLATELPRNTELRTHTRIRNPGEPETWCRTRVTPALIRTAAERAARALRHLATWPRATSAAAHRRHLEAFFHDFVERSHPSSARPPSLRHSEQQLVLELHRRLIRDVPAQLELEREEFLDVVERASDELLAPSEDRRPGVVLLDATSARGSTFSHLFLVRMNRDGFPRTVREDPLLPDRERQLLVEILPDLPLKQRGHDEERFLFSHLFHAAEHVTLSWLRTDEEGRTQLPSPLIWRLRERAPKWTIEELPRDETQRLCAPHAGGETRPRPRRDLLRLAALRGGRRALADVGEWTAGTSAADWETLARGLELREAPPDRPWPPDPWSGDVGSVRDPEDPRGGSVFVSQLEQLARCPWRHFLQKTLRLEPPADPDSGFPHIDARMLGMAVHGAMQQLRNATTITDHRTLVELRALGANAPRVRPASAAEQENAIERASRETLGVLAHLYPRMLAVLCQRVRSFVAESLAIDAIDGEKHFLAAEWQGDWSIAETREPGSGTNERFRSTVSFRADLVERRSDGTWLLSDYKTGKPLSTAKTAKTRDKHLRQGVLDGSHLQVAVYAAAIAPDAVESRYVHLGPGLESWQRTIGTAAATNDASPLQPALEGTAAALLHARRQGIALPRLETADGRKNPSCRTCDVRLACVDGDSSARRRLAAATLHHESAAVIRERWAFGAAASDDESDQREAQV